MKVFKHPVKLRLEQLDFMGCLIKQRLKLTF